jgi:hypothetical protein
MPASMQNGATVPVDYCVSTIARLLQQRPDFTPRISDVQQQLEQAVGRQFFYPAGSQHLSLQGCTQRVASAKEFDQDRLARIRAVCDSVLPSFAPVEFELGALNLVGNGVVIEAYAANGEWARMRSVLCDALEKVGESPISYPDKLPAHVNIARITNLQPGTQPALLSFLTQQRNSCLGTVSIVDIELLITDFVVSPQHVETVAHYSLAADSRSSQLLS